MSQQSRQANLMEPDRIPQVLILIDYFGIAVFAISGALVAAKRQLDVITFIFFAVVTAVGGGTVRDLLIGAPVFWVHTNTTLFICVAAALLIWVVPERWIAVRALLWFDAAGLGSYAAYGAAKALIYGMAPAPAFVMGVVTACAGGIIRDILAHEPSALLKREIYITAAVLTSGLFVCLILLQVPAVVAAPAAAAAGFALRGMAIARGWSLRGYRQ